ncbi:MAG: type II secretion system protein [Candidatus Paceibacterota bacterium]|jgi:prepilin-type N-terminal cleavage/methylation domain-containing protein
MRKGFTLIELLVVIAIIGLLSAVVMTALDSAKKRGDDAAVKSNMNNIVKQSLIVNTLPSIISGVVSCGSSPSSFSSDAVIQRQISATAERSKGKLVYCVSNGSGLWAVSAPLNSPINTGDHWCVDSDGFSGESSSDYYGFNGTSCIR